MALDERDSDRIARVGQVLLRRFDELVEAWPSGAPDLPGITRVAFERGTGPALEQQERLAEWLVAEGTSLDRVVDHVLAWEEMLLRRLARDALEDVFTSAAALNRFLHELVLRVAEGYQRSVRAGLEQAERLKSELISMVSHDLQTPLTTIRGAVDALLDGDPDAEDRQRFLQLIRRNAERQYRLIAQLLDLSSIENRALELSLDELDVAATARALVEGILPAADVRLRVAPHVPSVRADRDAVERILVNLIDNAVRLSPPGEPVNVELTSDGDAVTISVSDRGPGIPEDRRDGLFTRFYQVEMSHSGRRTGTGLGLAIVRGLAEAMGGTAGYEPNLPSGSVFWVKLPAAHRLERTG